MKRIIAASLIPILLLGNLVPHAHGASISSIPDDHSARAHIHLSVQPEHGHDHSAKNESRDETGETEVAHQHESDSEDGQASSRAPIDHDSTALYILNSDEFTSTTPVTRVVLDTPLVSVLCTPPGISFGGTSHREHSLSLLAHEGPPIYLLDAALRL